MAINSSSTVALENLKGNNTTMNVLTQKIEKDYPEDFVYDTIVAIRERILSMAAQSAIYSNWSDAFARKEVVSAIFNKDWRGNPVFEPEINKTDLMGMTNAQLETIGFRRWSSDETWMIPLFILNYLNPDDVYVSVMGAVTPVREFDTDVRGGMLAYFFTRITEIDADPVMIEDKFGDNSKLIEG